MSSLYCRRHQLDPYIAQNKIEMNFVEHILVVAWKTFLRETGSRLLKIEINSRVTKFVNDKCNYFGLKSKIKF